MNSNFYFNILNIGNNKDVKQVIEDVLRKVYFEYENKGITLERMCKGYSSIISNDLSNNRIDNRILNLKDEYGLYEHEVVLCRGINDGKLKYYLIDYTYPQFCGKYPYNNIVKSDYGKVIAQTLINARYIEINNEYIKAYINSFGNVLDNFKLDEYFNDLDKKYRKSNG